MACDTTNEPFGYCLNTSTVRGQELSLPDEIRLAAAAGYTGIEPWIREIDAYLAEGGSLPDLRKVLDDEGLSLEGAIGFFEWIVDDDSRRADGLEEARRNMDIVAQLGGSGLAAPPFGAIEVPDLDLRRAAERYRTLIELGRGLGVVPYLEVWGFSKCLTRLSEAAFVLVECGEPDGSILADVYHLHKGGSLAGGLCHLNGASMHVFHVNDYPAEPARDQIKDEHRVYPGDGVAPLTAILRTLRDTGFTGMLSVELFNPAYWQQDAAQVASTALAKTRQAVRSALA